VAVVQYTYTHKQYRERHITNHTTTQKLGRVPAVPRLCGFYPGICLTTEEKACKNLSEGSHIYCVYKTTCFGLKRTSSGWVWRIYSRNKIKYKTVHTSREISYIFFVTDIDISINDVFINCFSTFVVVFL